MRQATNHVRGLNALGGRAEVLTRRYEASWPRQEVVDGLEVRRFGVAGRRGWREKVSLLALWWWMRRRRSELTMVQTIMYPDFAVAATLAGLGQRTVAVWAALGEATDVLGPVGGRLRSRLHDRRRAALQRCRHVALTPAMQDELRSVGIEARVIPVPVDGSIFRRPSPGERVEAREVLGLAQDELVVIYTGRFDADKARDRLVEAFGRVCRQVPRARLVLVGGGEVDEVARAVRANGVGPQTLLPGVVDDVERYLWAADVFVLPSIREGLSNSLAEAMSCGLPCIAAAAAGGDQVLREGAGVVPPSSSVDDLTDALLELAGRPDLRAAIGDAAAVRSQMFAAEEIALRYFELLDPEGAVRAPA